MAVPTLRQGEYERRGGRLYTFPQLNRARVRRARGRATDEDLLQLDMASEATVAAAANYCRVMRQDRQRRAELERLRRQTCIQPRPRERRSAAGRRRTTSASRDGPGLSDPDEPGEHDLAAAHRRPTERRAAI
jgi:hypothetical protein